MTSKKNMMKKRRAAGRKEGKPPAALRRPGMTFDQAMDKVMDGGEARHPDMNARWHVVNSPKGRLLMSNVGGELPYVPSSSDMERSDWSAT